MNERKIVESFRTFFQKSVAPYVSQNSEVIREWNHLNKIISSDPIDYTQVEFYLFLWNKINALPSSPMHLRTSQYANELPNTNVETDRVRYNKYNSTNDKNNDKTDIDKNKYLPITGGSKNQLFYIFRNNLISNLQNFQRMLINNQERLQNISKRQNTWGGTQGGINIIPNSPLMREH